MWESSPVRSESWPCLSAPGDWAQARAGEGPTVHGTKPQAGSQVLHPPLPPKPPSPDTHFPSQRGC